MSLDFRSLGASQAVIAALEARGITSPFEIQTKVIPDAMLGMDILAKSRTGSGKTLAFAIPIVETLDSSDKKRPLAVILVPTRELASQVSEDFEPVARAKGLRVTAVYGGVDLPKQARKAQGSHILLATPGRLEDLCNRRLVDLSNVKIFILDEADRMLDMGFRPQVDVIARRMPRERQTMLFSATLDGDVGRMAKAYTTDAILHEVTSPKPTVDQMEHRFVSVPDGAKIQALADLLRRDADGVSLVFVRTKRGTDRLVGRLSSMGIDAVAMHGDMTQSARERSLKRFESGKVAVLVATDVAARGLDLDSITHVINFDPPEDHKAYLHRVGRTARAGREGTGITFVLPDQQTEVGRIAMSLQLDAEFAVEGMKVGPPAIAYASHRGRRSMMGRRPRRR